MAVGRQLYAAAYGVLAVLLLATQVVIIPVLVQMLLYTGCIIYIASHDSLAMFEKDPDTGEAPSVESVSKKDAMLFPVFGSAALFSMYVAYKFFGKYWVNLLLSTYLTLLGWAATGESLRPLLAPALPSWLQRPAVDFKLRVPLLQEASEPPLNVRFGGSHIVAYTAAAAVAACYLWTKNFAAHNVFAVSFSLQAISMISLGRFGIGMILLSGLFVYDIFWVFGTEVMVKVATQFDGPIKVIFPVSFDPWKQSILGLGDIVIPGVFVAMCLRFDAFLHKAGKDGETVNYATCFPKRYFWAVYIAYLAGLLTTGLVMLFFDRAQPALLYLVPSTVLTLLIISCIRGQFSQMISYDESHLGPKADPDGAGTGQKKDD